MGTLLTFRWLRERRQLRACDGDRSTGLWLVRRRYDRADCDVLRVGEFFNWDLDVCRKGERSSSWSTEYVFQVGEAGKLGFGCRLQDTDTIPRSRLVGP